MILYGDSSAILKLYVGEKGSTETALEVAAADQVATSAITLVELHAALCGALRTGRIAAADLPQILVRLQRDWSGMLIVPITAALLQDAAALTWTHGLRAADALHLASAVHLERIAGEPITLAAFDDKHLECKHSAGHHRLAAGPGFISLATCSLWCIGAGKLNNVFRILRHTSTGLGVCTSQSGNWTTSH